MFLGKSLRRALLACLAMLPLAAWAQDDPASVARRLNFQAIDLMRNEHFGQAEELLERALSLCKSVTPPDECETATLSNLGDIRHTRGKIGEAETLYRQSFETAVRAYGPSHPNVAQR